jgi:recombination protein RecT
MTQLVKYDDKMKDIRGALEKMRPQLAIALPKGMDANRLVRMTLTAVQRAPNLLDCDRKSLYGSVMQAAQLGLELEPAMGHAALVPFKGKVQLIPMFRGLLTLARRSGMVGAVSANCVFEGDQWVYEEGTNPRISHQPCPDMAKRGAMVAVYATAEIRGFETRQFVWLWKSEVDAVKARSAGARRGDSPWNNEMDYLEMAKKTALRRLCKTIPTSSDLGRAIELDDHAEMGVDQGMDEVDAEAVVVEKPEE